ncbi:hypothetical protein AMS68_005639 [Peltaster fructicola]|uniref:NADP-dependent oxidoreductase domain-containing protein n=1 Tax=Peltaster fructicola TaxID=286661 RepID=A0A6H0XZC1_9PEZI|nr:hypothetical protein AMS68_005639 [Peltaster fructicola]
MASFDIKTTFKLNTGTQLPALGFGVWDSPAHLTTKSCLEALKVGYRHIDTAQLYGNEKEVGEALKASGLSRSDVFITSKIYRPDNDAESTYQKCLESVKKIAGEDGYLDLMLIHNANVGAEDVKKMWQAMERLHQEGRFKAIGASNFGIGHIEELKKYAKVWPPAVNQLELHPWNQQREVVKYSEQNGIVLEAYCPLVRNQKADDPTLKSIAEKHSKTTAQVLLRYCLQKSWAPLPKSDNAGRIAQNADLYGFKLDGEDMKQLDAQDQNGKGALVLAVSNE